MRLRYTREMHSKNISGAADEGWRTYYEVYEQPLKDRLVFLAYGAVSSRKTFFKVARALDKVAQYAHERHCSNDCGTATRKRDGESIPTCSRLPLDVQADLEHFRLDMRNNKLLGSTEKRDSRVERTHDA